jgi:hypothetical protein
VRNSIRMGLKLAHLSGVENLNLDQLRVKL